ncbi:hypothetical protein VB636_00040, partial [Paracoccus sp. APAP_BH8]
RAGGGFDRSDGIVGAGRRTRESGRAATLKIDAEMLKRPVNVGFSGGEKKRNETSTSMASTIPACRTTACCSA